MLANILPNKLLHFQLICSPDDRVEPRGSGLRGGGDGRAGRRAGELHPAGAAGVVRREGRALDAVLGEEVLRRVLLLPGEDLGRASFILFLFFLFGGED